MVTLASAILSLACWWAEVTITSPNSHVCIYFHLFLCCFVYLSLSLCACCLSACQFFLCLYHFIIEPICVENGIFGCLLIFLLCFLFFCHFVPSDL